MSQAPRRADLRHVSTWLFDLDNTLYPAESGLMTEIERRMIDFVAQTTGVPRDDAYAIQKTYLAEHGLTLKGMMLNHGVDPKAFHSIFHDMSLDSLAQDPALMSAIERLPGRRLIFTNADDVHAERVLDRLGLSHLFDDVFHIGSAEYLPKPNPETFSRMVTAHAVDPGSAAFFEDSERNLHSAANLGIITVLVGPHASACAAAFVHHRAERLVPFLQDAQLWETT